MNSRLSFAGKLAVVFSIFVAAGCGAHGVGQGSALSGMPLPAGIARTAASTEIATPTQPTHILTWDKLGGNGGTSSIPWSAAVPWLTWADTNPWNSPAIHSLGIKTVLYSDPNRVIAGTALYPTVESDFAHDCNGNRLYTIAKAGNPNQALTDPHSQNQWNIWKDWYTNNTVAGGSVGIFDAVFEDTTDEVQQATGTPCNFVQSDWSNVSNKMAAYVGAPVIFDGLWALDHTNGVLGVSPTIAMTESTIGGMFEGCYSTNNTTYPEQRHPLWEVIENTEIQMWARNSLFICEGLDHTNATQAKASRIYMLASFLLTYHLRHTVYDSEYATTTGFHVMPETQLVPRYPHVTEPTDVSALQQSGGTYGREYGVCYFASVAVGPCAVVVNPGTGTKNFPWPGKYLHTLALSGSGVLDGGTASVKGPPPPSTVNGAEAYIVFK